MITQRLSECILRMVCCFILTVVFASPGLVALGFDLDKALSGGADTAKGFLNPAAPEATIPPQIQPISDNKPQDIKTASVPATAAVTISAGNGLEPPSTELTQQMNTSGQSSNTQPIPEMFLPKISDEEVQKIFSEAIGNQIPAYWTTSEGDTVLISATAAQQAKTNNCVLRNLDDRNGMTAPALVPRDMIDRPISTWTDSDYAKIILIQAPSKL